MTEALNYSIFSKRRFGMEMENHLSYGDNLSLIRQLVQRFEEHCESYRSVKYNEAQLRQEFLNPFFEALGWDVFNKQGYAESYKEVIHEASVAVEGASKAPDYAFRIGGTRKFFVEAKKPSVSIQTDIYPAFQLRRYAWSAKLPLGILTDFEEFAVYDCRIKPGLKDSAATGRILFVDYRQYVEKWSDISAIFSKDAVLKGSFDKYAEGVKGKKGTIQVDDAFLAEIEHWRDLLARNIALRNPAISDESQLNYAVQMTIDRIIFLRICEDRGIEPENQLQAAAIGSPIYLELLRLFKRADQKYNSGLFHFSSENGEASAADTFTPGLHIDDKIFKEILHSIYYPCPYIFREIPVEILGQVYEQFLGKVIRLTAGHQAKVEEKPDVRKAGGVYYTPIHIVNFIVQNTLGKLLIGKSPNQAANLKILDPACGSGSFLLGAYQHLLAWHLKWYSEHDPRKWTKGKTPKLYQAQGGEFKLTTAEKKRILLNNIHGVDIDQQAVEVTRLSLLLKVLEDETGQLTLGLERALPDLSRNIQCGNSLINPGYYQDRQLSLILSISEEKRIQSNAFDWQTAFPHVFEAGGFDVILGNPPYSAKQSKETKQLTHFFSAVEYKCDPYAFFIEQGLSKLKTKGRLGFIIPVTWMTNYYYMKLRKLLIDSKSLEQVILLDGLVFKDANVDTSLLFLHKQSVTCEYFKWSKTTPANLNAEIMVRPYNHIHAEDRYDISPNADPLWEQLKIKTDNISVRLNTLMKISLGMKLRSNDEFVSSEHNRNHPDGIYFGSDISRYGNCVPKRFFNFDRAIIVGGTKKAAIHRAKPKILIQAIRNLSLNRRIIAALDIRGDCFVGTVNGLTLLTDKYDIHYILGILNSNFINVYFRKRFTTISLTAAFLGIIPIRALDLNDPSENDMHANIVSSVERMLALNKRATKTPQEQEMLRREIESTDNYIDHLVYALYGLTKKEIMLVTSDS